MFCLRNYCSPAFALVREGATVGYPREGATVRHPLKFNSVVVSLILICGVHLVVLELAVRPILILIYCNYATGLRCQGSKTEISPCVENSKENWDYFQVTEACRMCEVLLVSLFILMCSVLFSC
jgi:hypothetical protein